MRPFSCRARLGGFYSLRPHVFQAPTRRRRLRAQHNTNMEGSGEEPNRCVLGFLGHGWATGGFGLLPSQISLRGPAKAHHFEVSGPRTLRGECPVAFEISSPQTLQKMSVVLLFGTGNVHAAPSGLDMLRGQDPTIPDDMRARVGFFNACQACC